jgi:membrane protein required for colicin V production
MNMSWLDIVIVLVIFISALMGVARGFVKEAVSVITWVAAAWLAVMFAGDVAAMLPQALERAAFSLGGTDFEIRNLRLGIAFVLLVVAALIVGATVNLLLAKVTRARVVKGADRLLGLAFGIVRGAAIIVIMVLVAGLTRAPLSDWWHAARLLPPFEQTAIRIVELLPADIARHFSWGRTV